MRIFGSSYLRTAAAIGAFLLCFTACGRNQQPSEPARPAPAKFLKPPPPIPSANEASKLMPKGFEKRHPGMASHAREQVARYAFQEWLAEKDHVEMVRPAPPGWKPQSPGYKVKLTLIPQKTKLRRRQIFRYRVEMQNVGEEVIDFQDSVYSLFKSGNYSNNFSFRLTEPDGAVVNLGGHLSYGDECPRQGMEIHFPGEEHMTPAQKDAEMERLNEEGWREVALTSSLWVKLRPGETLLSRPTRHDDYCGEQKKNWRRTQLELPVENSFQEMETDHVFEKIGTHRLQLVYRDPPSIINEKDVNPDLVKKGISREKQLKILEEMNRKKLGIVLSNEVVFELSWW